MNIKNTQTGIYKITNKTNGKYYIGSTARSFKERWKKHITDLSYQKHHSPALQRAVNKYGIDNFEFKVLHRIPPEYCHKLEQWYLNHAYGDYNCCRVVWGSISPVSREVCLDILKKYSTGKYTCLQLCSQYNLTESNIMAIVSKKSYAKYNLPTSLYEKCKLVSANNTKRGLSNGSISNRTMTDNQVGQILWLLGKRPDNAIAEYFCVHKKVINQIRNKQSYAYVTELVECPELLDKIRLSKRTTMIKQVMNDGSTKIFSSKKSACEQLKMSNTKLNNILSGKSKQENFSLQVYEEEIFDFAQGELK